MFEIPVGPVHAGVIEPGHFRFSVVGETIIDMKSRLYYTHKGVEKLFEGQAPAAAVRLAERISGDTTVGHALAYCQAVEAVAGIEAPPRARFIRTALLELERLHNHVADFGMIANDTGFAVAQSHCARIREGLLALNKRWTGSRLLRGAVVCGGVAVDWPAETDIAGEVRAAVADFRSVVDICLANTLLVDRLEGTGRLFTKTARDHGVLGYVARASGVDRDVRRDHPFAAYPDVSFRVPVLAGGDVRARAMVRVEEAVESAEILTQVARTLPSGPRCRRPAAPPGLRAGLLSRRGVARGHRPLADGRRGRPAGARQGDGPVLPQLAPALLRAAREHRAGLPALQQVVQPVLLRERSVTSLGSLFVARQKCNSIL